MEFISESVSVSLGIKLWNLKNLFQAYIGIYFIIEVTFFLTL